LLVLSSAASAQKSGFVISGYVLDAGSREALIGATLYEPVSGSGTATNEYGFFSLSLPDATAKDIRVSYVGYVTQYLTLQPNTGDKVTILLKEEDYLDEVVVMADEPTLVEDVQMSKISVPITTIKSMPALFGEVDILKTLQLLPGIQSGAEGTSGIYVRGGGPDQNLILLDGVPVYNASHLFGFFSVFNSDAVKHVDVYKGGFPARYGGRLSSVLDIRMKEGNMQEWHGEGGIGIISSRLTVEGPLKKNKTSMIVSGRRTYIDILARPIIKVQSDGEAVAGYYFYDFNTKFNYIVNEKNRLYASAYLGNDKFYVNNGDEYTDYDGQVYQDESNSGIKWGNITSSLRWNHVFSDKIFSNTTLTYSKYQFDLFSYQYNEYSDNGSKRKEEINANYISFIRDFALSNDVDISINNQHQLRTGFMLTQHRFKPGAFQFISEGEDEYSYMPPDSLMLDSWESQLYVEDDWMVNSKLKLNLGLHSSAFITQGRNYISLQPRISGRYLLSNSLSLKASAVTMRQFIHLLTNSGVGLPTDLWVPSTDYVKPQKSWQAAVGLAKELKGGYQVSLEGYYKEMDNLVAYKEAASYIDPRTDWQEQVTFGRGESYGTELFFEKQQGKLTGWLGYTLSWSNRQFPTLNLGNKFPYKYDRRHDVSVVLNYSPNKKSVLSTTWVYGTGNAITLPLATYVYEDEQGGGDELTYYSERNAYRMRAYHRMDLSYSRVKKVRWGERRWVFSVYNLYNRKNPFYINLEYDYETEQNKFVQYSLFTIIPSVAYNFKF
jgi:outer membrane cobalamin receptor